MKHVSVLKKEIVDCFSNLNSRSGYFFDGTFGLGGHSLAIIEKSPKIKIIGVDQDSETLEEARTTIKQHGLDDDFILIHNNFKNSLLIINNLGIRNIQGALLDLGVSSPQLDNKERGFSFQHPEQLLDMRMDRTRGENAADILNSYSKNDIERILITFAEERFSRKITEKIIEFRKNKTIKTVGDFLEILRQAIPLNYQKKSKVHFATKSFQAIRIEVNRELDILGQAILDIFSTLDHGSRLAIISFHSLEDRIVKETFKKIEKPCQCPPKMPCVCGLEQLGTILTRKPIIPTVEETKMNPRSRSAKLRIIEKL